VSEINPVFNFYVYCIYLIFLISNFNSMHSRKAIIKNTRAQKRKEHVHTFLRHFVIFCVLAFVLTGALAWASGYERFTIVTVRVEGARLVDSDMVVASVEKVINGRYGYLFSKRNILVYPRTDILAAVLDSSHRIVSATLHVEGNELVVFLEERKPSFVWCPVAAATFTTPTVVVGVSPDAANTSIDDADTTDTTTGCYFTDRDGMIYGSASSFSGPIFFTWYAPLLDSVPVPEGNRFLSEHDFIAATAFISELKKIGFKPKTGTLTDTEISIRLSNGEDLIFNKGQDSSELIANFTTAQNALPEGTALQYMDLRFGTKVFYKEKEENRVMSVSQ